MGNELYSREIAAGVPIEQMRRIKVLLAGAGNTGSHMMERFLHNFVENVFIIDYDPAGYEAHNFMHSSLLLQYPEDVGAPKAETLAARASAKALEPCNYVGKTIDVFDVGPEIVRHFDFALGFFDNVAARRYLYEVSRIARVPFLEVGISAQGSGQVQLFNHDKNAPCYCCNTSKIKTYQSCATVYEDDLSRGVLPNTDLGGSMVSTKAMGEIKAYLTQPDYVCNIKHVLDERTFTFTPYRMVKNPFCTVCHSEETEEPVICVDGCVDILTYAQAQQAFSDKLSKKVRICLPGTFVGKDYCPVCGKEHLLLRPAHKIKTSDIICPACRQSAEQPFMEKRIWARDHCTYSGFDMLPNHLQQYSLLALGFPYGGHILVMDDDGHMYTIILNGDIQLIDTFLKGVKKL